MYSRLLFNQQFKYVLRLMQQRQLSLITTGVLRQKSGQALQTNPVWTVATTQRYYSREEILNNAKPAVELNVEEDEVEVSNFSLKQLLYDETNDDILQQLNFCNNTNQLLHTMERLECKMGHQHSVQCVILLWYLHGNTFDYVTYAEVMDRVLADLRPHVPAMNANELSCCYLYLRKMSVPNTHVVLQELLLQALYAVETTSELPLSVLSRLVVGINTGRDFHTPTVCQHFMRHIEKHLQNSTDDIEQIRLLAVCLLNLQPLVDIEIIDDFKLRVQQLLANRNGTPTPRLLLKLLHLLNLPVWSMRNAPLVRDLMLELRPSIAQLNDNDLKTICRIFQHHMEPASLNEPLMQSTIKLLRTVPSPDALACLIPFADPLKREPLISQFKQLLYSDECWLQPNASANFFTILRGLKISDSKVCDDYWAKVMCELDSSPEEELNLRFMRHCHRYMNFNNNLGGTYRYIPLERNLSKMAMRTIEYDIAGRIPSKFARLAAFVMAYGHTPFNWKKFPNVLLSKIIAMSEQFSISDCFLISRGMQIAVEMRFRYHTPPVLGMQLATIDSILVACAERHLTDEQLTANDLNSIVRSLSNRKSLRNKVIYHQALNKYKEIDCSQLNTRIIRDMVYNFNASNYLVPKVLEAMFDYIEKNHEHIMGETVEKILSCSYNLGYTPLSQNVLDYAAMIIMRDFNYMSGLSIVQASLALCFYKMVPDELINKVFCVKFIQRIEEEIQMCYSKATYPERVLNLIMQLNRTVCLDFPEANVPWFQQNFIEAQLSKKTNVTSPFSNDVKELLNALLKEETYYRCNHTTPYGYHIDFVIHFDRDKKPIPAPIETTMLDRITKVAILLLKLGSYCENDLTALRGPEYLKMKHLEMMGYKVLQINEHDWNSKYMNAPGAKANYLKCLLQISN